MFSCHSLVFFLFFPCNKILWILILHVSCFCSYFLVSLFKFETRHALVFILIRKSYRLGCVCAHDTTNVKFDLFTSMVFNAHHIGLDHHKLINIRRFGVMVNSPKRQKIYQTCSSGSHLVLLLMIASNMVNGLFYFHVFQFFFSTCLCLHIHVSKCVCFFNVKILCMYNIMWN